MIKTNKEHSFLKGLKYPIYPTEPQKELLEKTFGCCRYVWNKALGEAKQKYEEYLTVKDLHPIGFIKKPIITGFYFANKLPGFKALPDHEFLSEVSYDVLQQTLINLGSAYSEFFKKRKGYPNFKKKAAAQSFRLTKNVFKYNNGNLFITKSKEPLAVGWGRNGKERHLPSYPSSCTISRTPSGKYYISFVCEYTPEKTTGTGEIGIDLGLKDFLVTSDGEKITNPKYFKQHEQNLRRKQQHLSRCQKESKRRHKARLKVAQIHERITNARINFHHQLSRKLINENQVIGIEHLLVKNMVKNRKLSKAISQAAWTSFTSKLIYKAYASQHCNIVKIDTFYPSTHMCNVTHEKLNFKLKLSDRIFECPLCRETHDRDINAARNIRDEALLQMAAMDISLGGYLILAQSR